MYVGMLVVAKDAPFGYTHGRLFSRIETLKRNPARRGQFEQEVNTKQLGRVNGHEYASCRNLQAGYLSAV